MSDRIMLRCDDVQRATGLGRTTIWRKVRAGEFPRPRQLGGGIIAWMAVEVEEWCVGRPVVDHEPVTPAA